MNITYKSINIHTLINNVIRKISNINIPIPVLKF